MAWEKWLKDDNEEPKFSPMKAVDENADYANPEWAAIRNGAIGFLKSLPGAVALQAGVMENTAPSISWDLQSELEDSDLPDDIYTKAAINNGLTEAHHATAPVWGAIESGARSVANAMPKDLTPDHEVGKVRGFFDTVLQNAPQMVGQAAVSAINPYLGATMMGASIAGDQYLDLRDKGVDPLTAGQASLANAAIQSPLEYLGMDKWINARKIMQKHGLLKGIGSPMAEEGITEAIQEIPDEMTSYIAEHGNLDGFDYGQLGLNAAEAGAVGAFYGGLFGGLNYRRNKNARQEMEEVLNGNSDNTESTASATIDADANTTSENNVQTNGDGNTPTFTKENSPNTAMYVMSRLVGAGVDPQTASGIVGGLMLESGGNTFDLSTTAENPSGAYGIAQWLDRREALENFAKERGTDPSDLDTQVDFLISELQGSESDAYNKIKGAESPEEAGVLADQYYERSEGTDDIRSAKSKNARAIYDAYVNGGSPVNNTGNIQNRNIASNEKPPESPADFLKEIEASQPLNTEEGLAISDRINDTLKNGSKEDIQNLAEEYGFPKVDNKVVADTPQTAEPNAQPIQQNAQETTNNASTTIQRPVQKQSPVQQKPVEVKAPNVQKLKEKKAEPLPGATGSFSRNATKPEEQKGGIVPQPTSNSFPLESMGIHNRDAQNQAPYKPVLPQRDNPNSISQNRPTYSNATRQVGIRVSPQTIKNGVKNKYLRNLVKQAFVDGDMSAMKRLSAVNINQDVLEAVKEDVIPNYRKVTPQEQQAVQPQSDTYTPTYRNREDLNRGMTEGQRNKGIDYVPEANNGQPISRQWNTPQEAMEAGRMAGDNANVFTTESVERNKNADKGLKARIRQEKKDERNAEKSAKARAKAQKEAEAKAKAEEKQAEEEHRQKVEQNGYTPTYRNREDIGSHMSAESGNNSIDVGVNGSDHSIPTRWRTPQEAMEGMRRQGDKEHAIQGNEDSHKSIKQKRNAEADKDLKEKIQKEKENESTKNKPQIRELLHRPEENKGDNTKSEQTGKQESTTSEAGKEKQGTVKVGDKVTVKGEKGTHTVKTVINKNGTDKPALVIVDGIDHYVKPEDITVTGKGDTNETHTNENITKESDKELSPFEEGQLIEKHMKRDAADVNTAFKEMLGLGIASKDAKKAKTICGKINNIIRTHYIGNSTAKETIDRINSLLSGKLFNKLPQSVREYLKKYADKKIQDMSLYDKENPNAEKGAQDKYDYDLSDGKDSIDKVKADYDYGKINREEAIKRCDDILEGYIDLSSGSALSHIHDKLKEYTDSVFKTANTHATVDKNANAIANKRKSTMELLKPLYGTKITNKETGIIATFASTGARKMVSGKAIAKSIKNGFTEDEHLNAVKKIKQLFENAHLARTHADKNEAENVIQIKRFVAGIGDGAEALITVKETKQAGHKIYSLELEEIKKASSIYDEQPHKETTRVEDASTNNIDESLENVNGKSAFELAPEYKKKANELQEQFDNGEITADELSKKLEELAKEFNANVKGDLSDAETGLVRDTNNHIADLKENADYEVNPDKATYEESVELANNMVSADFEGTLEEAWVEITDTLRESGAAPADGIWKNPFKGDKLQKGIYNREVARFKKKEAQKVKYQKGKKIAKGLYENTKKEIQNVLDGYRKGKGNKDVAGKAITAWRNKLTKDLSENADTKGLKFKDLEKDLSDFIKAKREELQNAKRGDKVKPSEGKSTTVRTDDGKEFKTTYKIVPADSLISSSTYDFAKNENYPSELQPRDRDRVSMREQVDDMARNLSPQDLAESRNVNEGAPVINQNNVVENGNGRTMAITRAYKHGGEAYNASAKAYKQFLMDNAEKFGYTKEQVEAMENPVLVRQRDSSSDNLQDSIIHSTNGGMKMSSSQQAQADVKKLTAKTLAKYNYDGSGDLTLESNRDFVTSVLNEVSDKSDRDVLFDKDGKPSKAGIERVRAVMTAAAYGNTELLDRMSESTDNDMQNVIKAYVSVAPRVASIRMRMENGEIGKDYNLPKVLSDALDFYFKCKAENKPVKFALNETGLFSDGEVTLPNETVGDFVRFMDDNVRKPRKISDSIEQMVKYVDGANESSMSLIPDAQMNLGEIVSASTEEMNQKYLVTNANLHGDDTVSVTRANGKMNVNEPASSIKKRLIKMLKGETFTTTADGIALKANNSNNVGHVATSDHYDSQPLARRALLAKKSTIESLIKNAVYVEEQQNKYDPNLPTHFVQLYTAAKFRGKYYRVKISAKKNADGTYTVTDANLYNIDLRGEIDKSAIKKASSPTHSQVRDKLQVTNTPLDTITVADLLNGVNDGNGNPYVVNGKLQYENGVKSIKNLLSETTDSEPITHHSVEEMKAQTMANFPNAKNVEDTGTHLSFDLPNGEHVEADFTNDTISVNRAKAQQDYGGTLKGDEKALGKLETAEREAFMTLSLDNLDETPSHEAMHLAMKFLTDRERNALFKIYKNEEAICEAYRKWRIGRKARQGALLGKIFQKISDFANKVLSLFRENDKNIFRKVAEGQVWERPINNMAAKHVAYMMDLSNVQEEFEQKYMEKAKDKVKEVVKGKNYNNDHITVKERPKDNDWSVKEKVLNNTFSPSRSNDPIIKRLYELADTATRTQQKLKAQWTERLAMARKLIKTAEQMKIINALLWAEDAEQHVYTDEEMRAQGIDEDVIKAHNIIRRLLGKMYQTINDTYTRATLKTKVYNSLEDAEARVKEAQASPFEEVIGEIRQVNHGNERGYQVTIKSPRSTKYQKVEMTADEFKAIKEDKYNVVTSVTKLSNGNYSISWRSYAKPLTNMEGYMPHFFHDFMIIRKGEDGNAEVVGSATSLKKAVAKAEEMYRNGGGDFLISPKSFQFEGELENPIVMGDKDYRRLINNITMNSTMSLKEAQSITQARMKGRHAFLGELKKRKGAEGFEDNAIWAIQHHIDASARYCALDPFKTKATNLFERAYGDSKKDYGRGTKQAFAKGYIESMMGKPTEGELFVNKILRYIPGLKNSNRPARLLTGMLAHTVGVLKLGASPAAGFVNLMQIFNATGYLGSRRVAVGIKRAMHPTMADLRILKTLGVDEEVGLADSDFGKVRLEDSRLGRIADRYTQLADKLMLPFSTAEKTIRRATVLAAYYKYMEEHAGETDAATLRKRAGNYAMEINRKVNFDYSTADAPRIFRAVQGTVIGDLALQFQKYGVKELEVIGDFLPYFGKNTTTKQKLEFFGYYLAVAGMWNAFPFQDLLMSVLGWMFDDDPEKMAKKAMMEWAGNDPTARALVNVANYGVGALVGMDISQRVGLKGVVPEVSGGGPLASTTIGLAKAIINGDTNGAVKSISPALGNIYGAIAGYNTDSKGRKTVEYDGWDRAMRALGFRTVKEATATDAQNIIYNYKDQKKNARDKAKAEYFKNPSSESIRKLKDLGYTDKQIKNLKDNKNSTRIERAQSGLSKDDMKKLKPVFDYAN